ncbi:hypothetical protein [Streptomyces sp. FxanaA7]|uniref:hypothetical protein n=1 Tax=Streptomyces sp. FxanaA7 TaxID=1265492 RepID=UPI0005EF785D|nr:hypothetical protein [Streptomyces sp. FxanaA7]
MSPDNESNPYGDVLAASPTVLAETVLRQVQELLTSGASVEDVREVVSTAVALLNMHQKMRPSLRRRLLGKVTSFTFPRTFSTGPLPATDDVATLREAARRHHHVCFTVQITDGTKQAVGREVEVQVPADDALRLSQQMARIAEHQLASYREAEQTSPSKGDQVT